MILEVFSQLILSLNSVAPSISENQVQLGSKVHEPIRLYWIGMREKCRGMDGDTSLEASGIVCGDLFQHRTVT